MEGKIWLGILLAIVGSTNLNVGKAIQKWKVKVFAHGRRMFRREHRRDLAIWIAGFGLTASVSVFYSLALKYTDKSSMVSSLNGVGMIGLVIFAGLVLKERIGRQELGGAGLVLLGTAVIGALESAPAEQRVSMTGFLTSALVLVAIFGPTAAVCWRARRYHGLGFGVLAGTLLGISIILGDIALVKAGNSFFGQLRYPWPYLALGVGTLAVVVTQLAFWRARAMVVIPTINATMILSPLLLEAFTFGTLLAPLSYAGAAVIVVGVVLLTATEKQERLGS